VLSLGSLCLFAFFAAPSSDQTFIVQTVAGGAGSADGIPATSAVLVQAEGVATDSLGNIYIADAGDHRIRRISPGGTIDTIAGTGVAGFSGDGGPAKAAQINQPYGLALDNAGNLYIADLGNARVRRVSTTGVIQTVAGGDGKLIQPRNVAFDAQGNLYISDFGAQQIFELDLMARLITIAGTGKAGFSGDGGPAIGAQFAYPAGLAVDPSGAIFVADSGNNRIRRISSGNIVTVAVNVPSPTGLGFDGINHLYIATAGATDFGYLPSVLNLAIELMPGLDVACKSGMQFLTLSHAVQKIASAAPVIVAGMMDIGSFGDGGAATSARLGMPSGVSLDSAGYVYIADPAANRIRRVSPSGVISTFAGTGDRTVLNHPSGIAMDATGVMYVADTGNNRVQRIPGGGGAMSTLIAKLNAPACVRTGIDGSVYVCDTGNDRILRVDSSGASSTFASVPKPLGLAVANNGTLYVSSNSSIVKVEPTGPTTMATNLSIPAGLALTSDGQVLIAESGKHRLLTMDNEGIASPIAGVGKQGFAGDGGFADQAAFNNPLDVAVDGMGNVYIADTGNGRVRELQAQAAAPISSTGLAMMNAATLLMGPLAPGEIVTIKGAAFDATHTSVTFDGAPATVFYASTSQLNVLVPSTLQPGNDTTVAIAVSGTVIGTMSASVAAAVPGIFTADNGTGQAIALNQDGTFNSAANPAARGDVIALFATGDGGLPPKLLIGGYTCDLVYAGLSPGFPGLLQVNARIPTGFLAPGIQQLVLSAGGIDSPPGVTISLR